MSGDNRHAEPETLPIVEERLSIGKRRVRTGRVQVRTVTETVDAFAEADLATSEIEVERVPVGREIDEVPDIRTEGDTVIVPVVEEVAVVVRKLVLREEIHIKRRHGSKSLTLPVQLLKQRAVVTREGCIPDQEGKETMADSGFTAKTLTAFFDHRADAEAAMVRLTALGIDDVRLSGGEEFAGRTDVGNDRGFWESISDFFFPSDDRATYAEGLRRGGFLVTARSVPEAQYDAALDILDDEGSVDLDERAESWRAEGWAAPGAVMGGAAYAGGGEASLVDPGLERDVSDTEARRAYGEDAGRIVDETTADVSSTGSPAVTERDVASLDEEVIPVVQESLKVGKRDVSLGRVRVRSYLVEEPVSEEVTLHHERVEVERRPVDRPVDGSVEAFTDRTIEAEEHAEEAVVSKEARVVEEIALRREGEDRTETVSDSVRHTEVEIEDDRDESRASLERTDVPR